MDLAMLARVLEVRRGGGVRGDRARGSAWDAIQARYMFRVRRAAGLGQGEQMPVGVSRVRARR